MRCAGDIPLVIDMGDSTVDVGTSATCTDCSFVEAQPVAREWMAVMPFDVTREL